MFTPPCLAGFDTAISCLLLKMENKSSREGRKLEREFDVRDGIMTFTYKQYTSTGQRAWLEGRCLRFFEQQGLL